MNRLGQFDPDPTRAERRRLFQRLDASGGPDACWACDGTPNESGYKRLNLGGTVVYAHRAAWRMANGPIPDGLQVLHHCDNPPCCNPRHLFLGLPLDNVRDALSKGRMPQMLGSLSPDQVATIRTSQDRPQVLAERFGITVRTVYRALRPDYSVAA